MQAIVLGHIAAVGKVLVNLVAQLATQQFVKDAVVIGLEKLVKKTESDVDDRLLNAAKKSWGME